MIICVLDDMSGVKQVFVECRINVVLMLAYI